MERTKLYQRINEEIRRAMMTWPGWPDDPIHGAAVVAEEAGELVKASLDQSYSGGAWEDVFEEALHTAATAVRMMEWWVEKFENC